MSYTLEQRKAARNKVYRRTNAVKANEASRLWRLKNPEKSRALNAAWAAANPQRVKEHARLVRLRKYGLSPEALAEKIRAQNGACAICFKPKKTKLVIDHCHQSQRVRGLLCRTCNMAIGLFHDNPDTLISAAKYLHTAAAEQLEEMLS